MWFLQQWKQWWNIWIILFIQLDKLTPVGKFHSKQWMMNHKSYLGGGFKYFLFSPWSLGKWSNLTCAYVSKWVGKNHQTSYNRNKSVVLICSNFLSYRPFVFVLNCVDAMGEVVFLEKCIVESLDQTSGFFVGPPLWGGTNWSPKRRGHSFISWTTDASRFQW